MIFNPLNHPICLELPGRLSHSDAWTEHIPFAFYLVDVARPKLLVELGTYAGNSYCAFCQAIQSLGLDTRAFAVDTWQGDEHSGFYGAGVLADLRDYHDPRYGSFSRLLEMTFDQAQAYFNDGSIDLLHIDGLHTYEAVKHDFEHWLPKLTTDAVVLFHDINVKERDFGVWKFWEELKASYRHLELFHGNGLGVIAMNGAFPAEIEEQINLDTGQAYRVFFSALGEKYHYMFEVNTLEGQLRESATRYEQINAQYAAAEESVNRLTEEKRQLDEVLVITQDTLREGLGSAEALQTSQDTLIHEARSIMSQNKALKNEARETGQRLAELKTENITLTNQIQLAREEISQYVTSTSWKLTRPLRKIIKKIRGF